MLYYLNEEKSTKKTIDEKHERLESLTLHLNLMHGIMCCHSNTLHLKDKDLSTCNKRLKRIQNGEEDALYMVNIANDQSMKNEIPEPILLKNCPKESCRGFMNSNLYCELCEIKVCAKCHQEKIDDHECNLIDVQSVESIKRETKKCPQCSANIFRIEGCNQMFCTNCKTTFDWKTGNKLNPLFVHNPHLIEWRRKLNESMPQNNENRATAPIQNDDLLMIINPNSQLEICTSAQDVECQTIQIQTKFERLHDIVNDHRLGSRIVMLNNLNIEQNKKIELSKYIDIITNSINFCRNINMIAGNELEGELKLSKARAKHKTLEFLRVQYLLNEINSDKFKDELFREDKAYEIAEERRNIFQLFYNASTDIVLPYFERLQSFFRRLSGNSSGTWMFCTYHGCNVFEAEIESIGKLLQQLENLREYVNKQFIEWSRLFEIKLLSINENWFVQR